MNLKALLNTIKVLSICVISGIAISLILTNVLANYIAIGLAIITILVLSKLVYNMECKKS